MEFSLIPGKFQLLTQNRLRTEAVLSLVGPALSLKPLSGIWSTDALNRDQVRRRLRVKETTVVPVGWSKQPNYHRGSNYSGVGWAVAQQVQLIVYRRCDPF